LIRNMLQGFGTKLREYPKKKIANLKKEAASWGVNPAIFIFLWLATWPVFGWGVADCVRNKTITLLGVTLLAVSYIVPYGYVFVLGRPSRKLKMYILAIGLFGFYSTSREIGVIGAAIVLVLTIATIMVARYFWGKR